MKLKNEMTLGTNLEIVRLLKRIDLEDLKAYEKNLNNEMNIIARESMDCEGPILAKTTYDVKNEMLSMVSNEINYKMNVGSKVTVR